MKRSLFFRLPLLCILIWFLADAPRLQEAARQGLALCAGSVIPALFPFLVVSSLLTASGFAPAPAGLMQLFRLPACAGSALVLGLTGGYPVGARTAVQLFEAGALRRNEAERLLTFCNNAGPAFLISVVGTGVFGSVRTGLWLWLIHILSALLTGLLLCRRGGEGRQTVHTTKTEPLSPAAAFVRAVVQSADTMLHICAFVVLFRVLSAPLLAAGGAWAAAAGALELFSLLPLLTADRFGFVLAAAASGWGGLSVAAQTAAILSGSGLRLRFFLCGKLLQSLLSALLAALAAPLLL